MKIEEALFKDVGNELHRWRGWFIDMPEHEQLRLAEMLTRTVMRSLERHLPELAAHNFVRLLMAEQLYVESAEFHYIVNTLSQCIVMAGLGRAPLSRKEMDEKINAVLNFGGLGNTKLT